MKYCDKCGAEMMDEAVVCTKCGCAVETTQEVQKKERNKGLDIAIKIFMILGCISSGLAIIPLFWTVPMTISASRKMNNGEPIGVGFKICTLLFVSMIAGILLLCRNED